ncbi:MAG: hypothetical protein HXK03_04220 [Schaalia georgiae]|uniref:Uncharacterized protein n=1 Tax=Schaalia georgiae TaxID=52768 RepID=A0A929N3G0_9ACTO|nr:hypothetical protein [Schaalia georgiae]
MNVIIQSVMLGIVGGGALKTFYSMVKNESPMSYTYDASHLERVRGLTVLRYLAFRTVPVFCASLAVVVTACRLELVDSVALASCILLFMLLSSVRSIFDKVRGPGKGTGFHSFLQALSIIGTAVNAYVAHMFSYRLSFLIPEPEEFVGAVWTAVFVGVVAHCASGFSKKPDYVYPEHYVQLVIDDVGKGVWEWAKGAAQKGGVPWCVLSAIIIVEVGERPRWMRMLERGVSAICFHRVTMSFGVTQEQSRSPLSDEESIEKTVLWIREHLSDRSRQALITGPRGDGAPRSIEKEYALRHAAFEEVKALADSRNPDGRYGEMVSRRAREMYNSGL